MGGNSYELGQAALRKQEWPAAVEAFTAVLAERRHDPAALYQRGKAFYCQGLFYEAQQDFKRAAHLSPNLPGVKGCFRHAQLAVESERSSPHQPAWFGLPEDFLEPLAPVWREPENEPGRLGVRFALLALLVLLIGVWALRNL